VAALEQLKRQVDDCLLSGQPLSRIERDLVEPCDLTEDEKSALWLYAWAYFRDGQLQYQQRLEPAPHEAPPRPLLRR
jgi:hypothetical protein